MYKLMKYNKIFVIAAMFLVGVMMSPALSLAQATTDTFGLDPITGSGDFSDDYDDQSRAGIALGTEDLVKTITSIINVVLSLLGIVSVVIILAGGFKWMTAGGNEEKVTEARKIIFAGIIGLAIILSAWAIAKFVLSNLGEATGTISEGTYDDLSN